MFYVASCFLFFIFVLFWVLYACVIIVYIFVLFCVLHVLCFVFVYVICLLCLCFILLHILFYLCIWYIIFYLNYCLYVLVFMCLYILYVLFRSLWQNAPEDPEDPQDSPGTDFKTFKNSQDCFGWCGDDEVPMTTELAFNRLLLYWRQCTNVLHPSENVTPWPSNIAMLAHCAHYLPASTPAPHLKPA